MISSVHFHYYVTDTEHPLSEKSPLWTTPLPRDRFYRTHKKNPEPSDSVTYGEYVEAITTYLSQENFRPVRSAARRLCPHVSGGEIPDDIRIFLVKHGEYYHPCRVEMQFSGQPLNCVLNGAVSQPGLSFIHKECRLMDHLNTSFPYAFIPGVFDAGEVFINEIRPIRLFIGEWFDGYYEFHLSRNPQKDTTGIIVWDESGPPFFLNEIQTVQLFEEAAHILTAYYNPLSLEQISSWHHAAGDFVVKITGNRPVVKLITVRNYGPLVDEPDKDLGTVLDCLLIFLLNLSIRIRLDRLDGVGDAAWAGKPALKGCVQGFFKGLDRQTHAGIIPAELVDGFKTYLSSFTSKDLINWATTVVDGYHPDTFGLVLIHRNLDHHIEYLRHLISDFLRYS